MGEQTTETKHAEQRAGEKRRVWLVAAAGLLVAAGAVIAVALASRGGEATVEGDYAISGDYFETCSCDPACPCVFDSEPTHGYCSGVLIWHVTRGSYRGTPLSDLTVVIALTTPGHMRKTKVRGMLYTDAEGTEDQQAALAAIFASRFPELFDMGPTAAPIAYRREGETFIVEIPDVLEAAVEPLGEDLASSKKIEPAHFGLDSPLTVTRSLYNRYSGASQNLESWDLEAGRSGFVATFHYSGDIRPEAAPDTGDPGISL